jgi:hypothetical protein
MKQHQAIQYLALDVHQATTVTTVRTENGSILMRATVATEARAIVALVRGLGPGVHVVFEEGTQAQWLHDLLLPLAARVVVCNVREKSETSNKSDRIDADWLSEQLRLGALKSVYHGSPSVATREGAGSLLHEPRGRLDASDAASQGHGPRTSDIGTKGETVYRPQGVAGQARGARSERCERRRFWRSSTCCSSCEGRPERR